MPSIVLSTAQSPEDSIILDNSATHPLAHVPGISNHSEEPTVVKTKYYPGFNELYPAAENGVSVKPKLPRIRCTAAAAKLIAVLAKVIERLSKIPVGEGEGDIASSGGVVCDPVAQGSAYSKGEDITSMGVSDTPVLTVEEFERKLAEVPLLSSSDCLELIMGAVGARFGLNGGVESAIREEFEAFKADRGNEGLESEGEGETRTYETCGGAEDLVIVNIYNVLGDEDGCIETIEGDYTAEVYSHCGGQFGGDYWHSQ